MHSIADNDGNTPASNFAWSIRDGEGALEISNVMPVGYLPTPKSYLIDRIFANDQNEKKRIYSNIKKRDYIPTEALFGQLNSNIGPAEYISLGTRQQIRVGIQGDWLDIPGAPNDMFSIPQTVCNLYKGDGELRIKYGISIFFCVHQKNRQRLKY